MPDIPRRKGTLVLHALTTEIVTLSRPRYGHASTEVVGARVVKADAEKFRALAKKLGQTPGETLRVLVALAVKDPTKTFAAVAKLLELPPDALPTEVLGALEQLVSEVAEGEYIPPAGGDPLSDTAADEPPAKLSKVERDYCTKHGFTEAQFLAKKSATTRGASPASAAAEVPRPLTEAELRYGQKHGIAATELRAHLATKKATAVRRAK